MNKDVSAINRRLWIAVVSLSLGSFASVTTEFLPVGVLQEVAASFGISTGEAGLMMTLPGIFAAIAAPGVLIAAGNTDRRIILIALSVLLLISAVLSAWAPDWQIMLFSRALTGLSLGAFWAMGLAVAGKLVEKDKAHKAIATVFAGVTAAMILGVPFGTYISGILGWRSSFTAAAVISLIPLVLQLLYLPGIPAEGKLRPASMLKFLRRQAARKSVLLITLIFGTHFGTYTFLAPLLSGSGLPESLIIWVLLGFGIAGFAANFVASAFVNRNLRLTMVSAMILMMLSLLIMSVSQSQIILIAGVLLWGMAWGALPLCLNISNKIASGELIEAGSVMFTFTAQVSIALGSAAGGILVDYFGTSAEYQVGCIFIIAGVLAVYFYNRREESSRYEYHNENA